MQKQHHILLKSKYNKRQQVGEENEARVLVESTSALSLDNQSDMDVLIEIVAFGKKQYSSVKKKVGVQDTFWGEHFYFQHEFESTTSISKHRVKLAVYDRVRFRSNSLIGLYDIDLLKVYEEEDHKIEHLWCGLVNIQQDFSVVTGYIKVSLSLIGQGDKNQELAPQSIASIGKDRKIMLPPMIEKKTYQITADIIQAIDISPVDGGTVDSYVGLEFGQTFQNSQPVGKNCRPRYHNRLYLPLFVPAAISNIVLRLIDFNFIQRGEVIGSQYINIDNLISRNVVSTKKIHQTHINQAEFYNANKLRWANFYGPQRKAKNKEQKNIHQFYPELASSYVGSILLRVQIQQASEPIKQCQSLSNGKIKQILEVFPSYKSVFYRVTAKITAGLNLYKKNQKYKICVQIGGLQIETDYEEADNGFCVWNYQMQYTIKVFENQIVPDIFIYLVDHKNRKICYTRHEASDNPRKPILQDKWINLKPDLSMVDYKLEEAGYLKLGLTMAWKDRPTASNFTKFRNDMINLDKKNRRLDKIYIELISAHSLIPLDEEGASDPFFTFSFMNSETSSSIKNDTVNPIYLQVLTINTYIPLDQQSCPPLIINAYDKDKLSKQLIGTSFLDIGDLYKANALSYGQTKPEPKQFPIKQNNIICGYFIANFYFIRGSNRTMTIPPQINFRCKKFKLLMVALGLRGLKPNSIFPVKRPYIEFNFESLSKFNQKNSELKKKTLEIQESGNQIRIYKPLIQTLFLPENVNYWPTLSAVIRNGGGIGKIYKSILGYCSINLQSSFKNTKQLKKMIDSKEQLITKQKKIHRKTKKLECLSDNSINSIRSFLLKATNYKWKLLNDKMKLNSLSSKRLIKSGTNLKERQLDPEYIVLFPEYIQGSYGSNQQIKQKEKDSQIKSIKSHYIQKHKKFILSNTEYMPIGYDNNQKRTKSLNERNKHYRFVLDTSFQQYCQWAYGKSSSLLGENEIRRGRTNMDSQGSFNALIRKISTEDMKSGIFKADVVVVEDSAESSQSSEYFIKKEKNLIQKMLSQDKVIMFLYLIDARNLPSKDTFSDTDTYLIVKAGKKEISLKKNTVDDQLNPDFYQKVRLQLDFPTDSIVEIQVWDNDPLKKDQLIGSVTIDIENRFQSHLLQQNWNNPIQTHDIMYPTSKISRGLLRFWMDLVLPENLYLYKEFDISPKPPGNYEVRIIVWSCDGMPINDFEGMSDLFIACQFNGQTQQTDVHYRTQDGQGHFNWRMIFPIQMPAQDYQISLKCYDKDIFSRSEYLASCSFNIEEYLKEVFETDTSMRLFLGKKDLSKLSDIKTGKSRIVNGEKRYDRFWVDTMNRDVEITTSSNSTSDVEKVKLTKTGRIQISIEILTEKDAKKKPAGKGRQDPNQNPFLPEPKKRFAWSLNPFKIISQTCGDKFKVRICIGFILLIFLTVGIYFLATFWGGFAGAASGVAAS